MNTNSPFGLKKHIKERAEQRGYKVLLEESTLDGGFVLKLLKDENQIAVQILAPLQETSEVQKYLSLGYYLAFTCSTDRKQLNRIRKLVEPTLDSSIRENVFFFEPDDLFLCLDQLAANELSSEENIKGYKVKVAYIAVPEDVAKAKNNNILKAVSESMRKAKRSKTPT